MSNLPGKIIVTGRMPIHLELNTTPTNSVYGAMQDGYVERVDQKISPRPSLPVYDRKRITKEGDNNFPLWQTNCVP